MTLVLLLISAYLAGCFTPRLFRWLWFMEIGMTDKMFPGCGQMSKATDPRFSVGSKVRTNLNAKMFPGHVGTVVGFESSISPGIDRYFVSFSKIHSAIWYYEHQLDEIERIDEMNEAPAMTNPSAAADFLRQALDALEQRAVIRDTPGGERSADRAANILTAWTGRNWSGLDVWQCLIAVKLARSEQGAFHPDDYVDLIGYSALAAETRAKMEVD